MTTAFDEMNNILKSATDKDGHKITQQQWDDLEWKYAGCIDSLSLHLGAMTAIMNAARELMASASEDDSDEYFVAIPAASWRKFVDEHAAVISKLENG